MSENEKQKLEKELIYVKILIKHHVENQDTLWKDKEKEFEEYMNAMLDFMNEIRKKISKYE